MKAFTNSGGRLFKIALIFTVFCVVVVALQATYLKLAMAQVYELATTPVAEGEVAIVIPSFYGSIIPFLSFAPIVQALSIVLVSIAARYGAREATKNISEGMKYKSTLEANKEGIKTSDEVAIQ